MNHKYVMSLEEFGRKSEKKRRQSELVGWTCKKYDVLSEVNFITFLHNYFSVYLGYI